MGLFLLKYRWCSKVQITSTRIDNDVVTLVVPNPAALREALAYEVFG